MMLTSKKTKMKRLLFFLLVGVLILITACGGEQAKNDGMGRSNEIVIADSDEWWGLDVTQLDGSFSTQGLIADPIVLMDENGNLTPSIASEVNVSEDGKTIRLTFPEGMKFANGEPLNPEDVVASLARAKEVSPFRTDLEPITSMEIEDRDVVLNFNEFTSNISNTLSGSFVTVMSKKEIDSKTNDELLWDCTPYGLYSKTEYVPGSHIVMKKNPYYKTHKPDVDNKEVAKIETIKVRFIKEEFSRINAFNVDDVQVAFGMSLDGLNQLTNKENEILDTVTTPNVHYLEMNQNSKYLSDIKLREAIGLAINREDIVETNKGAVIEAYSVITSRVLNYSEEYEKDYKDKYTGDIEKAKKLIEEAGWTDGDNDGFVDKNGEKLTLKLVGCAQPTDERSSQAIQIQLKDIGIDLEIDLLESNYRYETIEAGEFDIGFAQFGTSDPIMLMNWILCNADNFVNQDEFYGTIQTAQNTPDSVERTQLLTNSQRILEEEIVIVPLYTVKEHSVWSSDLNIPRILNYGHYLWNDLGWK